MFCCIFENSASVNQSNFIKKSKELYIDYPSELLKFFAVCWGGVYLFSALTPIYRHMGLTHLIHIRSTSFSAHRIKNINAPNQTL
jgi:hypothetical protein